MRSAFVPALLASHPPAFAVWLGSERITSKGGTTHETITSMESAGVNARFEEALFAAQKRAGKLARGGRAQHEQAAIEADITRYGVSRMPTKVQELIARLEADGWYQVRQKGIHRQYHHASKAGTVTVAGKPSVEVPPGTLNSILKQAGLKK